MKRKLFDELRASVREGGAILRGSRSKGASAPTSAGSPTGLTSIIKKRGDGYVALCPELDIASEGDTPVEARANLKEALELFCETADPSEIKRRLGRPAGAPALERPRRTTRGLPGHQRRSQ